MASEIKSLWDLWVDELKDLFNAENQITKALPKVIREVTNSDLKRALEMHLRQTEQHVGRLDTIFSRMNVSAHGKKCLGIEGILAEGKDVMGYKVSSPDIMDAALIAACQKVEHYEIVGYGTARAWAELLGESEAVNLLTQTLSEEKAADEKLNQIGMNVVNIQTLHQQQGMRR